MFSTQLSLLCLSLVCFGCTPADTLSQRRDALDGMFDASTSETLGHVRCVDGIPQCMSESGRCIVPASGASSYCASNSDCIDLIETPICDVERGECVRCLPWAPGSCGGNVCADGRCTAIRRGRTPAHAPCEYDEECQTRYCVLDPYYRSHTCMHPSEPGGDCLLSVAIESVSQTGVRGWYCAPPDI